MSNSFNCFLDNLFYSQLKYYFIACSSVIFLFFIFFPLLQNNNVTPTSRWVLTLEIMLFLKVTLYDLNVCHYLSVCSINWNLTVNYIYLQLLWVSIHLQCCIDKFAIDSFGFHNGDFINGHTCLLNVNVQRHAR